MDYKIHTFGCKVNTYDTGLLQSRFETAGLDLKSAKVHVLNTCAVTGEATREAVRYARRLKAKDPFCKVVVTGCAAQVDTEKFDIPGADLIVANSHKGRLEELIQALVEGRLEQKIFKSNIFLKKELEEGGGLEEDHTRSFLKIQDGCNSFCTFCVIPFARGRSRSLSIDSLVSRVNRIYESGIRETVLTGVHIGDYEDEGSKTLEDLLEALLERTQMPRFRLSSLEPIEISERLLDLYKSDRFCPHFHMSIQSANTGVLAGMKRKYTSDQVESALLQIAKRVPGAFVGMDVIAGFPGETAEDFEDTLARLARLPWTRLHVFPYSERPGTKAIALAGKVAPLEIKERARRLRVLSAERHFEKARAQVGLAKFVLPLRDGRGLTRDYWNVRVKSQNLSSSSEGEFSAKLGPLHHEGGDRFYFEI